MFMPLILNMHGVKLKGKSKICTREMKEVKVENIIKDTRVTKGIIGFVSVQLRA